MRIERRSDGKRERLILTGMIVSKSVLARITDKWNKEDGLFKSKWSNLIGGWCVDFMKEYDDAPGKAIEGIFESWSSKSKDKDTIKLAEAYLSDLSSDYETHRKEINPDYIVDKASDYFNRVAVHRLKEALEGDLDTNETKAALKRIKGFGDIEIGTGAGIDVLQNKTAIRQAFESKKEPLITFPDALGEFFGDSLERDGFIAFEGPEKRGKSWILQTVGWQAMLQRRRVAFFEVGDMSQDQIMRRFMIRAAGKPLKPCEYYYPVSMSREPEEPYASVSRERRNSDKPLSWSEAEKACTKLMNDKIKSKNSYFRLSTHPNSSVSISGLKAVLNGWSREGWNPDVVVVDYADILAPLSGTSDTRDQINGTWKGLRSLSQSLHCLVVTASQSDAGSYEVETLSMRNFSEDKRKRAHTTGTIGINQTPDEYENGVIRLNWIVRRGAKSSIGRCVHVAGCLDLARPFVLSTF